MYQAYYQGCTGLKILPSTTVLLLNVFTSTNTNSDTWKQYTSTDTRIGAALLITCFSLPAVLSK